VSWAVIEHSIWTLKAPSQMVPEEMRNWCGSLSFSCCLAISTELSNRL